MRAILFIATCAACMLQPERGWGDDGVAALGTVVAVRGAATNHCLITPRMTLGVGSPLNGVIDEVLVERGDLVAEGKPIAVLRSDVERVQLELSKMRAENTAALDSARDRLAYFEARNVRNSRLLEREAISQDAHERSRTELLIARSELRAAELEHEVAQLEYERARVALALRTIRSPVSGVVVERHLGPSEFVHDQAKLVTLAVVDKLHVEVYLPVASYLEIQHGAVAIVRPEAPIGGAYEAEVVVVDSVFDAASGTFGIRLLLDNVDGVLPAGMKCRVEFQPSS